MTRSEPESGSRVDSKEESEPKKMFESKKILNQNDFRMQKSFFEWEIFFRRTSDLNGEWDFWKEILLKSFFERRPDLIDK